MTTHANTLYVQTPGAYLGKDGETVRVKVEGQVKLTVPLHHLEGIVCFGRVNMSTSLMAVAADRDLTISFFSEQGRFQSRVVSATSGNVLLRREQYRRADQPEACLRIARSIVAAKIQNSRNNLLRGGRESDVPEDADTLKRAANHLANSLDTLSRAETLDSARGCEGDAARAYFGSFNKLIRQQREAFSMTGRSRRPPLDPLNALLSFVYSVLTHEMAGALESVGLDPAVGFLHVDRPGRLSLALDLLEEFRALLADRLVLSLINLKQVRPDGFEIQPGGAVQMDAATRKTLLTALTQRKRDEITHPVLGDKVRIGLLPHIQARLLARHIRGDLEDYPALVLK
jgi:CRISPR-associated protein Cas1